MRETAILTARGWTGTGPWYQTLAFKEPVTDGTAKVIQGASEKQQKAFSDGSIQVSTINGWLVTFKATGNKPIVNIPIDFTYNLNSSEPLDSVVIVGTRTSSTTFSGTITKEAFNRLKEGNVPLIVSILDQTTKGTSMAIKMPSYTYDVQSNTISAMAPVIPAAGSSLNFWAVLVNSDYSVGGFVSAGGGSGGATVSWTQIVTSGTRIGTITINGIDTAVFAPNELTEATISVTNTSAAEGTFTGTQSMVAGTWADIINGKATFKITMTTVGSVSRLAIVRDYIKVDANTIVAGFVGDDFTASHTQKSYTATFTYNSATLVMSATIVEGTEKLNIFGNAPGTSEPVRIPYYFEKVVEANKVTVKAYTLKMNNGDRSTPEIFPMVVDPAVVVASTEHPDGLAGLYTKELADAKSKVTPFTAEQTGATEIKAVEIDGTKYNFPSGGGTGGKEEITATASYVSENDFVAFAVTLTDSQIAKMKNGEVIFVVTLPPATELPFTEDIVFTCEVFGYAKEVDMFTCIAAMPNMAGTGQFEIRQFEVYPPESTGGSWTFKGYVYGEPWYSRTSMLGSKSGTTFSGSLRCSSDEFDDLCGGNVSVYTVTQESASGLDVRITFPVFNYVYINSVKTAVAYAMGWDVTSSSWKRYKCSGTYDSDNNQADFTWEVNEDSSVTGEQYVEVALSKVVDTQYQATLDATTFGQLVARTHVLKMVVTINSITYTLYSKPSKSVTGSPEVTTLVGDVMMTNGKVLGLVSVNGSDYKLLLDIYQFSTKDEMDSLEDEIEALKQFGRKLSGWDCTTGLASPEMESRTYANGDYFVVTAVGATNYRPSGTTYTKGTASTTVETETVAVGHIYHYDGISWTRYDSKSFHVTFGKIAGDVTDNVQLANALNAKQNKVGYGVGDPSGGEDGDIYIKLVSS